MRDQLLQLIPEFLEIQDPDLRERTLACFEDALQRGGWVPDDLRTMPFTLLLDPCPASMAEHVRGNVLVSLGAFDAMKKIYGDRIPLNRDILVSGALLHDVGKLLEYARKDGKVVKSRNGKLLRHPMSGTALAFHHGLPEEVQHIIAVHAKEGEGFKRTPEAVILHHADFTNFETFH
ncbi:MAG TPA: HD domain-containing protein [Thermoanaerobaculia bacterium]|nr:HD domain-containing protein [Thermoanaerobaculia bacterium]HUM28754.1 HD domain-containing protein [Thermoanaerobaculia bacterium]HXK67996.1 HD domain-containing protein [Thermoanaerobaculia bacterium]